MQAGRWLYSTPRVDNSIYTHVEAGFPEGSVPESWNKYAGDVEEGKATIYSFLPYSLLVEFIYMHGGVHFEDLHTCAVRALHLPFFNS